jgi:hypothetical protein
MSSNLASTPPSESLPSHPVPRTFGLSWPLVLATLGGLVVMTPAWLDLMFQDGNIFMHLAAARWMLTNGQLPTGDPFSYTMPGAPWVAQEWLSAMVLYGAHRLAGWSGMAVLMGLSFALTLGILARFLCARLEPVHALFLTILSAALMLSYMLVRPHVLSWPLTALWFSALVSAAEGRRQPPWWLLPVMVIWANLYGGFTLGLLLAGGIAADALLTAPAAERVATARRWALFLLLAVLASMVTPHGWRGIWFTVHLLQQTYSQSVIVDWKSPDFHVQRSFEFWLLLALGLAWSGRLKLSLMRILMVLGLVHLALMAMRSISTLGLIAPFLLAAPLARGLSGADQKTPGADVEHLDRWFRALAAPARPLAMLTALIVAAVATAALFKIHPPRPSGTIAPVTAVDAARAAGVSGPVLDFPNFGGYLIEQGIPVFIDGRMDMYGDPHFKRFFTAVSLNEPGALQTLLEENKIGWTLLPPGVPANAVLDVLPGWRRVHADPFAVVYMRSGQDAPR